MRLIITLLALLSLALVGVGIELRSWGVVVVGGLLWIDLGRGTLHERDK